MARLLIIEDGVALASLLVSATSERGHLTSAFHAGSPGLQAASEERFDLAVVDLLLPDLRGAEVLERLRSLGVPTIAMSGVFKGDRFARDAVERHGARAFFEKPFALERLLDAIDAEVLRDAPRPRSEDPTYAAGVEADGTQDAEAVDFDFDLEVDVPTAEIHLDHPTTELELNPEALEAFQEALQHSAGPTAHGGAPQPEPEGAATGFEEDAETSFAGVLDDAPDGRRSIVDAGRAASRPAAPPANELGRAEPDDAAEEVASASTSDEEITAPSPRATRLGDDAAGTADDEVTGPSTSEAVAAVSREGALATSQAVASLDNEVTQASDDAPTPDFHADALETGADVTETAPTSSLSAELNPRDAAIGPSDDGFTAASDHALHETPENAEAASSGPEALNEALEDDALILLPSDVIPDAAGAAPSREVDVPDAGVQGDDGSRSPEAPSSEGASETSFEALFDADDAPETAPDSMTGAGSLEVPADVADHVDQSFAQATQPTTGRAPQTPFSERAAVWEGESVAPTSRSSALPPPEASLDAHGLYDLLNACHQSRFTGTLNVEGEGQRRLTLVDGHLVSIRDAADQQPLPSIAELSVREGQLDEELFQEVRELAGHEGLTEDEAVVLMGLMTPEQLSTRAQERLRPLLTELLGWTDGRLHLTAGAGNVEVPPPLRVPLAGLIFESILARGEDAALTSELPDDLRLAPTEDPPYELGEIPLSGPQAQLLAHSDGSKSVGDLALLSDLDQTDVRLTLWALIRLGILAPLTLTRSTRRITFGL